MPQMDTNPVLDLSQHQSSTLKKVAAHVRRIKFQRRKSDMSQSLLMSAATSINENQHSRVFPSSPSFERRAGVWRSGFREKAAVIILVPFQSARGLAHSKTLRAIRLSSAFAPASWSAVALHRFPTPPRTIVHGQSFHFENSGRPSGTWIACGFNPALKCRAMVIPSLCDRERDRPA